MAFTEDFAVFFGPDDPGVSAAYYDGADTPIYGEFRAAHSAPLAEVEDVAPTFLCALASVPGLVHDKTLLIEGTTWLVKEIRREGTGGLVELALEEQSGG